MAVAVLVILLLASISACVTTYVAVKICPAPGAKFTLLGVIAESVPEPLCTSERFTSSIEIFPVLLTS